MKEMGYFLREKIKKKKEKKSKPFLLVAASMLGGVDVLNKFR